MEQLIVEGVDLTEFLEIPYVPSRHPGEISVDRFLAEPQLGSNCQLFALGVLAHAGFHIEEIPPEGNRMGSRELWLDKSFTCSVSMGQESLKVFDLLFFLPRRAKPHQHERFHMAICLGEGRALHNAFPGTSAVWNLEDFHKDPKGYELYGARRPICRSKN